jgi:hypothetical protein
VLPAMQSGIRRRQCRAHRPVLLQSRPRDAASRGAVDLGAPVRSPMRSISMSPTIFDFATIAPARSPADFFVATFTLYFCIIRIN